MTEDPADKIEIRHNMMFAALAVVINSADEIKLLAVIIIFFHQYPPFGIMIEAAVII